MRVHGEMQKGVSDSVITNLCVGQLLQSEKIASLCIHDWQVDTVLNHDSCQLRNQVLGIFRSAIIAVCGPYRITVVGDIVEVLRSVVGCPKISHELGLIYGSEQDFRVRIEAPNRGYGQFIELHEQLH